MRPRLALAALAASLCIGFACFAAHAQTHDQQEQAARERWESLKAAIFADKTVQDDDSILSIDAPFRAEDAAVVPIGIHLLQRNANDPAVKQITLVVDANPSPLAAVFKFGDQSGIDYVSTRIRVDEYTNVHAVAELADGSLHGTQRFVKAAGGCSAPAAKQDNDGIATGTLRFRLLPPFHLHVEPSDQYIAQVMVHHPNYSGMQMDQMTRLYVPAFFVRTLAITQADRPILSIDSGISIAQNPEYRFEFHGDVNAPFRVVVQDSDGNSYAHDFTVAPPS
jgi:sulfur-oxidizing protein SoxY